MLKSSKSTKIGNLSLVSGVTRAPFIKILMFITKKYKKLAEIFSNNLENHGFFDYHPSNNGHVTGPQS